MASWKSLTKFDKVILLVSFQEGKNVNIYGEEVLKVLKFHKNHRKASVVSFLIKYAELHA